MADLQHAAKLDNKQWRYGKGLINYYLEINQPSNALTVADRYYKQFPENYLLGMLYAKSLLQTKNYNSANKVLQTIKILPNEGATDGRQLYKEVQLMLAVEEMKNKNYKNALDYITAARQWPENLGVGKPYESDIDERLEDWLAYQNYTRLNNQQEAQQSLNKILSYTSSLKKNILPSPNNLVSAWAIQKTGKKEGGEKFLNDALVKDPNNITGNWALNIYKGNRLQIGDEKLNNENYRVLKKFIQFEAK